MTKINLAYPSDPHAGQCSECKETFSVPPGTPVSERGKELAREFDKHVEGKHRPMEDFSQAAARVVGEATED
jgi:hypothetical protein